MGKASILGNHIKPQRGSGSVSADRFAFVATVADACRLSRVAQVATFALAMVIGSVASAQAPANNRATHPDKLDKLIDAVASRNKEPRIVKLDKRFAHSATHPHFEIGGGRSAYGIVDADGIPLFCKGYDWSDQDRVRNAAWMLARNDGDDLWPRLVEHSDDRRYAATLAPPDDRVQNWSVGNVCRIIAIRDLNAYLEYERFTERRWGPRILERARQMRRCRICLIGFFGSKSVAKT